MEAAAKSTAVNQPTQQPKYILSGDADMSRDTVSEGIVLKGEEHNER